MLPTPLLSRKVILDCSMIWQQPYYMISEYNYNHTLKGRSFFNEVTPQPHAWLWLIWLLHEVTTTLLVMFYYHDCSTRWPQHDKWIIMVLNEVTTPLLSSYYGLLIVQQGDHSLIIGGLLIIRWGDHSLTAWCNNNLTGNLIVQWAALLHDCECVVEWSNTTLLVTGVI